MDFTLLSFEGRLTEDPELRTSESGKSICKFTVACNERISKDEERTTYIPTTVFGRTSTVERDQAEICAQYLSKGRTVRVVGKLETDTYTDRDGNKRKGFACVVVQGRGGIVEFGPGGQRQEEPEAQPQAPDREAQRERIFKGKRPAGGQKR